MKYFVLFLYILAFAQLQGQEDRAYEMQLKYFNEGNTYLKNGDKVRAFISYSYSVKMDSTGIFAEDAGKKRDSIRSILRSKLVADFQGVWKVITSNKVKSEDDRAWYNVPGRIIRISQDTIACYSSLKDYRLNNPLSIQPIKFIEIRTPWPAYNEIIHYDNKIWSYSLNLGKNRMEVIEAGKYIDKYNYSWIVSHPSGNRYKRIK